MSGTESSGPKIKLKIAKPEDAMQVDPPSDASKAGAKNTKKNVGTGRSKTVGAGMSNWFDVVSFGNV